MERQVILARVRAMLQALADEPEAVENDDISDLLFQVIDYLEAHNEEY